MKISIGITSYNYQDFLPRAIASALAQTYPCEVLVCDDGSIDNSLEVARSFPVSVISQVNKGLSSARNTLIMNMSGDFFLPLDADDILAPDCVDKIVRTIEENNADIISPSFKCFGKYTDQIILMPDPKLEDFKTGNRIGYCSAIKRDALLAVGGYSPKMLWGYEDLHLWVNLLTLGKKIVTIPEVLWFYMTKEKSMITESIKHHEELMNQIFKDFPEFNGEVLGTPLPR